MINLGTYNRLDRTYNQLILNAIEECNTKITDGFINLVKFNDGLQMCVEIRYYKNLSDIPVEPFGMTFELKNGALVA